MSTGLLGQSASKLGNIALGTGPESDLTFSVVDTLALVQVVNASVAAEGNVATALALVQTVVVVKIHSESVSDPLGITDLLNRHIEKAVSDNLGLTDSGAARVSRHRSLSDDLGLSDSGTANVVRHYSVSDTLALTHDVEEQGPIYLPVAQSLGITDSVDEQGPIYVQVQDILHLAQPTAHNPPHQYAAHALQLQQKAGRVLHVSVSNTLAFTQDGYRRNIAIDHINFVQTVQAGKGPSEIIHALGLTQQVHVKLVVHFDIQHALDLTHSATYLLVSPCAEQNYSPFVGLSTSDEFTTPSAIAPTLGHAKVTLTYPFVTPTRTLVLRNPDFGNRDRLNFNRINRETRGGTLIVFADPIWPKSQTLVLQISAISDQQASDLKVFLSASLGKEVGLLDYENRQWRGVITNPDVGLVHNGLEGYSVSIEFQGSLA